MRLRKNEIEADELGYRPSITLLISVDLNLGSLSNLVRHNCQFDVDEALTKRQHLKTGNRAQLSLSIRRWAIPPRGRTTVPYEATCFGNFIALQYQLPTIAYNRC